MSPIRDLQAAFATTYRIRLGQKVASKSGRGMAPSNLGGAIRVTSPAREAVEAFVIVYGGTVGEWVRDDGAKEWQAILPTNVLPVVILPGSTLVQWWEVWDSGGCVRRCDGLQQVVDHGARPRQCQCPQPPESRMHAQPKGTPTNDLWCKPKTQILVVCPEVNVAGAGRLVTGGLIAARQLPATIAIAEGMLDRGFRVPAFLRVVHHQGRRDYVVPQLDLIGVGLLELDGGSPSRAAVGGQVPALPVGRPELAAPTPPAPVPTTDYEDYGSDRRGDAPGSPDGPLSVSGAGSRPGRVGTPPAPVAPDPGRPFTAENEILVPFEAQRDFARDLSAWCRERYPGPGITKTTDAVRHAVVSYVTGGRTSSSKAILLTELPTLLATLASLRDGSLIPDVADDGGFVIVAP